MGLALLWGDKSFIIFNCVAAVAILGFAMFAYFKKKQMRYIALVLASVTVVMYVLTFAFEGICLFDKMSIVYALILVCNILFATMKRMDF